MFNIFFCLSRSLPILSVKYFFIKEALSFGQFHHLLVYEQKFLHFYSKVIGIVIVVGVVVGVVVVILKSPILLLRGSESSLIKLRVLPWLGC